MRVFVIGVCLVSLTTISFSADAQNPVKRPAITGSYQGQVYNENNMDPVVTNFVEDSQDGISGSYAMGEDDGAATGTLSDCFWEPPYVVVCTWEDKYGAGTIRVLFNATYQSFQGFWGQEVHGTTLPWSGQRSADSAPELAVAKDHSLDDALIAMVDEFEKKLPSKVDFMTTLKGIDYSDRILTYQYELIGASAAFPSANDAMSSIHATSALQACSDKIQNYWMSQGIVFKHIYYESEKMYGAFEVTISDCETVSKSSDSALPINVEPTLDDVLAQVADAYPLPEVIDDFTTLVDVKYVDRTLVYKFSEPGSLNVVGFMSAQEAEQYAADELVTSCKDSTLALWLNQGVKLKYRYFDEDTLTGEYTVQGRCE